MDPPIAYTGAITGYLIESALYCEYKPYIEAKRQTRITPGLARRTVQRTLETIRKIPAEGKAYVKLTLAGEIMGYPAVTTPDAVYFENGQPKAIIRGKIRPSLRDYPGDWATLNLAGILLNQITNAKPLHLILVLAIDEESLIEALQTLKTTGVKPYKTNKIKIITRIFDEENAIQQLTRPIKVLIGEQLPKKPSILRCSKCPLRRKCPYKLL